MFRRFIPKDIYKVFLYLHKTGKNIKTILKSMFAMAIRYMITKIFREYKCPWRKVIVNISWNVQTKY